jgi:putative protein-disulfide isomerase
MTVQTDPDDGPQKHLLYVADPMCSWCYGFAPVVEAIADHFGERLPIQLMMGGLRAGNTKPFTLEDKQTIGGHWRKVEGATGQKFDFAGMEARQGWVYDTEPACRAVVTMRLLNPGMALAYKARIQRAFYAEARDTAAEAVLADIAAEAGVDREMFFAELVSQEARRETQRDFLAAQKAGIRGFPTLLAGDGEGRYIIVTNGYRPLDGLPEALEKWLDAADQHP